MLTDRPLLIAESIALQHEPPCISIYQPTHRHRPENQQNPIRFRNLLKTVEESLRQKYPTQEIQPLMEPFRLLESDRNFWNHTLDGLAILGAPGLFRIFRLQRPVSEFCAVADSFHVKPLIRILQSAGLRQFQPYRSNGFEGCSHHIQLAGETVASLPEVKSVSGSELHYSWKV